MQLHIPSRVDALVPLSGQFAGRVGSPSDPPKIEQPTGRYSRSQKNPDSSSIVLNFSPAVTCVGCTLAHVWLAVIFSGGSGSVAGGHACETETEAEQSFFGMAVLLAYDRPGSAEAVVHTCMYCRTRAIIVAL